VLNPRSRTLLIVAAAISTAMGFIAALPSASDGRSVSEVLRDPLSLFEQRSPGGRAAGVLVQTKPQRKPLFIPVSSHPVPSGLKTRGRRDASAANLIAPPAILPETLDFAGVEVPNEAAFGLPPDSMAGFFGDGGLGVDRVISGSIGGGGLPAAPPPTGDVPPTQDLSPISPVPEPQTWMMMLCGFFLLGRELRKGRRGDRICPNYMGRRRRECADKPAG
jgi:hypothetical protein